MLFSKPFLTLFDINFYINSNGKYDWGETLACDARENPRSRLLAPREVCTPTAVMQSLTGAIII